MVARNILFIFLSSAGASALSLLTVPVYLHLIGTARFGVLAFVWLIVGYFGLFILGLDKAITNLLAQHRHDPVEARRLFHTAMLLNVLTSTAGALVMWFVGYQLMVRIIGVGDALRGEFLGAMPWIAASVPLATTTALLIGTLEAYERFSTLAYIQFSGTVLFQAVPILVAWQIGPELTWVLPAAILSRCCSTLWMLAVVQRTMRLDRRIAPARRWVRPLLSYGGSISISGIVSPILTSLDRVLIGAVLGASAISFYVVPYNLITAVQLIPGSLLRVLFPRLSVAAPAEADAASAEAALGLAAVLAPLITCGILLANAFFHLWLGAAFARQAFGVPQILLAGAWINCLAWVPVTLLQAQGRPGVVARLHVIELAPFIGLVWLGVRYGGLEGAAIAASVRVCLDGLLLFWVSGLGLSLAGRLLPPTLLVIGAVAVSFAMPGLSSVHLALALLLGGGSFAWSARQVCVARDGEAAPLNRVWASLRNRQAPHRRPEAGAAFPPKANPL